MLAHLTWGSRCIYSRPITAHQDIETKSDLQESLWCNLEVTQVKKKHLLSSTQFSLAKGPQQDLV